MDALSLFPDCASLSLNAYHFTGQSLRLELTTTAYGANCPLCGQLSNRVHSHYRRTLTDLPCSGMTVRLELQTRKFFCDNVHCQRRIFTEPLPALAARSARRTLRLQDALRWIGLFVGGEAGARLSRKLRLQISPDTLLRAVTRDMDRAVTTPRVLGVDDFALRRGRTYGTLLIDLERRCRVDLLPDRRADTFAAWLKAHPGIEIISRDRGEAYADGARQGAPDAIQVADRWHLLKNMGEALERLLIREHRAVREAAQSHSEDLSPALPILPVDIEVLPLGRKAREHAQRRERRLLRYQQVFEAHEQGLTIRGIARRLGFSRKTVQRYLATGCCPETTVRAARFTQLQPFHPFLRERWNQGDHNAAQLWREIQVQGYGGGYTAVKDWIRTLRSSMPRSERRTRAPATRTPKWVPTARTTTWLLLRDEEQLDSRQRRFVERLIERSPTIGAARKLARLFLSLVRERRAGELESWITTVENSGIAELRNFATGLLRDKSAVLAGMSLKWSNGQTEGQVNRLKLVKRQMYGRAGFTLLRARVLAAA